MLANFSLHIFTHVQNRDIEIMYEFQCYLSFCLCMVFFYIFDFLVVFNGRRIKKHGHINKKKKSAMN